MSDKKKSAALLPKIIAATTDEEAIQVLNDTLELLYLGDDYLELLKLKNRLNELKLDFKEIEDSYRAVSFPREYSQLAEIRDEIAFLYRTTNDELSYEINRCKLRWSDEGKTAVRAQSIIDAKWNEELIKVNNNKALSLSSLESVYGITDGYKEYLALASSSYGLFQELIAFFASMNKLSDSVASQASHALQILNRDVK